MPEPLYQTIYNNVKSQILSGVLSVDSRAPTEFEIVQKYNVSRITATRALNELEIDGYIKRIPRIGSIVLDVIHRNKDDINNFKTISLVLPFSTESVPRMLSSMQQAAQENGYYITPLDTHLDLQREKEILQQVAEMSVDGVICYPIDGYDNLSFYANLKNAGIPIVTIDKKLPLLDIPSVTTHNTNAIYQLTKWLIGKGHRNIAFCCGSWSSINERYRFHGYLQALIENQILFNPKFFLEVQKNREYPYEIYDKIAQKKIRGFLEEIMSWPQPATALICSYDLLAYTVVQQAKLLKIDIPKSLSITGMDNLYFCDLLEVPLTTLEQDFASIGRTAFDVLLSLIHDQPVKPLYLFETTLIERKSVRDI